jgi:quercetin dioxygenase-like cupin family protein
LDRQSFEETLKRDGYEIMINTTVGEKTNPVHSHPYDVRAMVLDGALTMSCDGKVETYKAGETFTMTRGCLHAESYGPAGAITLLGRKH